MISPTLAVLWALLRLLHGGEVFVYCGDLGMVEQQYREIKPNELWTISCVDSWNADGTYHYVPSGGTQLLAPACNTYEHITVYQKIYNVSNYLVREASTVVPIHWQCPDKAQQWDSAFEDAAKNVGKSTTFWAFFGVALGGGMFIGAVMFSIRSMQELLEGGWGKDD